MLTITPIWNSYGLQTVEFWSTGHPKPGSWPCRKESVVRAGNDKAWPWRDGLIALVLAIAAGVASYETSKLLPPVLLQTYHVWFESDLARVYDNMADRWSNHYRTKVHPLFSLLTHPLVYAFTKFVGLAPTTAIRILNAVVAGAWLVVLFSIMRLAGCRMFDAVLFSLIAACSAGAVFWLVEIG